jgi:predicted transcriptional regulator
MVMARTQTLMQLTDDLVRLLDEEAAARGISRSALVREVLSDYLASRREAALSQRIVEGYRRIPPARPDEWGELGELGDHATADLLQRLDAEERRGGHEPW